MLIKSGAFLTWVGYSCVTYGMPNVASGPLWLIGRSRDATLIGVLAAIAFTVFGLLLIRMKSKAAIVLSVLLVPLWLIIGFCVASIADW